jgi:hypothetical protein
MRRIPGAFHLLLLITLVSAVTATATTWYVDSSATGSKNGTSWANAWASLSSISGVKAGDVVYISGGVSGSSHTYSVSGSWTPPGGSSGNPITYQIGQDSSHNGTAIFSGSGYAFTPANYTVISGDAGDGGMHFAVSGYSGCASVVSAVGVRIGYVNFGSLPTGVDGASSSGGPSAFEFDHNYAYINDTAADHFMFITPQDNAYDGTKIHDNTVYVPRIAPNSANSAFGADGFQIDGAGGWSLYNNQIHGYICSPSYSGGQHEDGTQPLAGSYIKIYNNTFSDLANSAIFLDGWGGTFNHVRIYNNICQSTSSATQDGGGGIAVNTDNGAVQAPGFTDVIIDDNLIVDTDGGVPQGAIAFGNLGGQSSAPFSQCYCYNNVLVNAGNSITTWGSPISMGDNIYLSSSQAQGYFVQYKTLSPGNNYQLAAGATSLIGKGANESSYFTTDMNGNLRSASGAWDIGPYAYGSSGAAPSLSLAPVSASASDVDANTAGLQVYEGTTVQFSSSASYSGTSTVNWQWTYTVNGGSTVVYQSGSGAIPSVSFNFATGTGGNTYVWTLLATAGTNSASASLTMSVEVPPAPNTSLTFQATSGTITAPLTVTGNYISQSVTSTTISATGEATYNFTITNAGNYVIQALVNAPNDSANSFYVNIDAQPVDPTMAWDIFPFTSGFQNTIVSWRGTGTDTNNQFIPKIFALTAGTHQIIFAGREANTELESFSLLQLPATPQNLRVLSTVMGNAPSFSAGP